jgi:hypothetical protein
VAPLLERPSALIGFRQTVPSFYWGTPRCDRLCFRKETYLLGRCLCFFSSIFILGFVLFFFFFRFTRQPLTPRLYDLPPTLFPIIVDRFYIDMPITVGYTTPLRYIAL